MVQPLFFVMEGTFLVAILRQCVPTSHYIDPDVSTPAQNLHTSHQCGGEVGNTATTLPSLTSGLLFNGDNITDLLRDGSFITV